MAQPDTSHDPGADGDRLADLEALPPETAAAVIRAGLAIGEERRPDEVLRGIVSSARRLTGARYAALGVPDAAGAGFSRFLTEGMDPEVVEQLGHLPRTHGMLGAMLAETRPYRTDDLTADDRFEASWPPAHPTMRTFLGVPIVRGDRTVGAIYLTEKAGGFTDEDVAAIRLLAAHAAIAIEHAQLHDAAAELHVREERERLARDLHDSLAQTLFSLTYVLEGATDGDGLETARTLAARARRELRTAIEGLRPADLDRDGLLPTLRFRLRVLERAHDTPIRLTADDALGLADATEPQVLAIVEEAVVNALRHADAAQVDVSASHGDDRVVFTVADDGDGFDPGRERGGGRMGLVSMRERSRAFGGRLAIDTAPGRGTTVRLTVPTDGAAIAGRGRG